MDTIVVAAIVAMATILSPMMLAHLTGRQRRAEKIEDYARLDLVAERAAQAAAEVKRGQEEAARLLLTANEHAEEIAGVVTGKLDQIHILVNSSLSAAIESELSAMKREVALMLEVGALREAAGRGPDPEAAEALAATRQKIAELQHTVNDRKRQTDAADRR